MDSVLHVKTVEDMSRLLLEISRLSTLCIDIYTVDELLERVGKVRRIFEKFKLSLRGVRQVLYIHGRERTVVAYIYKPWRVEVCTRRVKVRVGSICFDKETKLRATFSKSGKSRRVIFQNSRHV